MVLALGWSWRRRGPASAGSIPWGSSFHASTLRGVGRPTGGLNAELLCVLGVQSLPTAELHGLGADDAADGSSAEKAIQNIETNVPPAAPIEMKRRSMLVPSVRRVPPPKASSSHRTSAPPQLYSSTLGASARVTVVSVTCGVGAPTVVSYTVVPTAPRLPSASKGATRADAPGRLAPARLFPASGAVL